VIAYRATLDVLRELVQFTAKLLLAERRRRGTPRGSRALTCFCQTVLGLRWFRDRVTASALARDHGISRATGTWTRSSPCWPPRRRSCTRRWRAKDEGLPNVILDGTIIPADRCKEPALSVKGEVIDLWYSGKAHAHGGNIHAVLAPNRFPLWISEARPGSVHDLTAARRHALPGPGMPFNALRGTSRASRSHRLVPQPGAEVPAVVVSGPRVVEADHQFAGHGSSAPDRRRRHRPGLPTANGPADIPRIAARQTISTATDKDRQIARRFHAEFPAN
jgi:hypothetical protein